MAAPDLATLGIRIDASDADTAAPKLDNLAKSGENAERSTRGVTSATSQMQAAIAGAIGAINANTGAVGSLQSQMERLRGSTQSAGDGTASLEQRLARLKASVDPLGNAIDRVSAEISELNMMHAAGAISAADHARYLEVLTSRATQFQARQAMMNMSMVGGARSAKLQSHEMLNLSRQFADIAVTGAMGMNPLMILVQQGPQIADVLGTARARGIGLSDMFKQIAGAVAPFIKAVLNIGTIAGIGFGAFSLAARGASNEINTSLKAVQKEFGYTDKQIKKLEDSGVSLGYTMGDVMSGLGAAIADAFNFDSIAEAISGFFDWLGADTLKTVRHMVGMFGGAVGWIKVAFTNLPAAIGAAMVGILNVVITSLNDLMERGTRVLNNFINMLPDWVGAGEGNLKAPTIKNVVNPGQGMLDDMNAGYDEGYGKATSAFDRGMGDSRESRLNKAAGDPDKERNKRDRKPKKPRESQESKDWKSAIKEAEEYTKALKEQTQEIGLNQFQLKELATTRAQNALELAAEKAALAGIAVDMDQVHRLTQAMAEAQEEWNVAMRTEGIRKLREELDDEAKALQFENTLIGMNAEQRARATKEREINLKIIALERDGHFGLAEAVRTETAALIDLAGAQGAWQDKADAARRVSEIAGDMAERVRDVTSSFGELFGTVGEGFSNMLTTIYDFSAAQEEAQAKLTDLATQHATNQISAEEYAHQRGRTEEQMAQAQIAHYGNMLGAAKTFFKEGSTGYKVLEGVEKAYRLFQFAMAIKAMFFDKAQTASSVANSGARAAADGVAAVAKAIASLPFPLNIAAGAATIAFLVGIGVKMFGGGGKGGGGASASASKSEEKMKEAPYSGPRDEYGNPTSAYSVLRPGETTVAGQMGGGGNMSAPAAAMGGGGGFRGGDLVINGGADRRTTEELQGQFQVWSQQTVEASRRAAAADRAAAAQRQQIGGR